MRHLKRLQFWFQELWEACIKPLTAICKWEFYPPKQPGKQAVAWNRKSGIPFSPPHTLHSFTLALVCREALPSCYTESANKYLIMDSVIKYSNQDHDGGNMSHSHNPLTMALKPSWCLQEMELDQPAMITTVQTATIVDNPLKVKMGARLVGDAALRLRRRKWFGVMGKFLESAVDSALVAPPASGVCRRRVLYPFKSAGGRIS